MGIQQYRLVPASTEPVEERDQAVERIQPVPHNPAEVVDTRTQVAPVGDTHLRVVVGGKLLVVHLLVVGTQLVAGTLQVGKLRVVGRLLVEARTQVQLAELLLLFQTFFSKF